MGPRKRNPGLQEGPGQQSLVKTVSQESHPVWGFKNIKANGGGGGGRGRMGEPSIVDTPSAQTGTSNFDTVANNFDTVAHVENPENKMNLGLPRAL